MPAAIEATIRCAACGSSVDANAVECPRCGVVIARNRIRQEADRPTGEVLSEATSDNLMGNYQIRQMPDGSLFCNCLSFLGQRGTQNGHGHATCKHINRYFESNPGALITIQDPVRPSEFQKAALKRLGVQNLDLVTNDQAYWIFKELLRKQGVTYKEYKFLMGRYNNIDLLPIFSFGSEFELGISPTAGRDGLSQRMTELGLDTSFQGYTHDVMATWKIVTDSSVDVPSCEPMELVTPKLFGAEGFGKVRLALQTCNSLGSKVNSTCGFHVHVDAYWNREEVLELAKAYLKIEQKIFWPLVPPSRRNNRFALRMTREAIQAGLASNDYSTFHRYHSLNLNAFSRYKTVEFRIHNGTTDPEKAINWIVFLLKTCDWVKRGGRSTQIDLSSLTIGSYLDLIGMGESATSRLRRSREYIMERYNYWMQDAAMNPANRWTLDNANVDDLTVADAIRPQARSRRRGGRPTVTTVPPPLSTPASQPDESIFTDDATPAERIEILARLKYEGTPIEEPLSSRLFLAGTDFSRRGTVAYLATMFRPTRQITYDDIRVGGATRNWHFASQSSSVMHNTVMTLPENGDAIYGVLECSCPGFRERGACVHTISVARYCAIRNYATRRVTELLAARAQSQSGPHRERILENARIYYNNMVLSRPISAARYGINEGDYNPDNLLSVAHLAFNQHPTRRTPSRDLADGVEHGEWQFVSESNPNLHHRTTLVMQNGSDNVLDAAVNCTCQAWRSRRYCVHSINVARYMIARRRAERA